MKAVILAAGLGSRLPTNNPAVLLSKYYNPKWSQFFEHPDDINFEWIMNNDIPDYKYRGEYLPLLLLEMIEKIVYKNVLL